MKKAFAILTLIFAFNLAAAQVMDSKLENLPLDTFIPDSLYMGDWASPEVFEDYQRTRMLYQSGKGWDFCTLEQRFIKVLIWTGKEMKQVHATQVSELCNQAEANGIDLDDPEASVFFGPEFQYANRVWYLPGTTSHEHNGVAIKRSYILSILD